MTYQTQIEAEATGTEQKINDQSTSTHQPTAFSLFARPTDLDARSRITLSPINGPEPVFPEMAITFCS